MHSEERPVYPLTPTQQGMLFHHLSEPRSGVDIEQILCTLEEQLDTEAFQAAWQEVIGRHPALRTRFRWEGMDDPVQEVVNDAFVSLRIEDWRQRSAPEQEGALQKLLENDRAQGCDLSDAPSMRLTAIRIADAKWHVLWTFPHILCDGRSFSRVLGEVFARYDLSSEEADRAWPEPAPFADHVMRVNAISHEAAEAFWRNRLAGLADPTSLPGAATVDVHETGARAELERALDRETTEAARTFCEKQGVTLNTLVQGAWALLLARWGGTDDVVFGATRAGRAGSVAGARDMVGCLINTLPVRMHCDGEAKVADWLRVLREREQAVRPFDQTPLMAIQGWSGVGSGQPLFQSLIVFDHQVLDSQMKSLGPAFANRHFLLIERTNYPMTLYAYGEPKLLLKLAYDESALEEAAAERVLDSYMHIFKSMVEAPDDTLEDIRLVSAEMAQKLLVEWNDTRTAFPEDACIHHSFEAVAARSPDATALFFRGRSMSYGELNRRANRLAFSLLGMGVGPDVPVALCAERGFDLMVALFAIHKAGGCYVPLDPEYPSDRLAFMLEDSRPPVLLTQSSLEASLPRFSGRTLFIDDEASYAGRPESNPTITLSSSNLAYIIYTSGSTGKPKGVMVEHRQVQNFFTAMDQRIPLARDNSEYPGTWLAVTSLSFDISVLELFWTLARGFRVVLHEDQQRAAAGSARKGKHADRSIDFSLMYFSSADTAGADRYRLLLEGAKFADKHGFAAIWTPERHFHEFGGLFPNPSLTSAALAMVTENVALRAGSVVGPLHHAARIAEEWAMVDNLSGGRVGVAFASGWQPRDFVLAPEAHGRKELMFTTLDAVQALWAGEEVTFPGPAGQDYPVRTLPRPVQSALPIWLTAAGSPETFQEAGRRGAGVLTHFLGQSREELIEKIAIYRQAWKEAGHEGQGHVTLMLHTFVGDDVDAVKDIVREPMKSYLGSSLSLVKGFANTWTAFKKRADGSTNVDVDLDSLTEEEMSGLLEYSFERYFEASGLFGDIDRALDVVDDLKGLGIDEIACLIDFGVDEDLTLEHLRHLNRVKELAAPSTTSDPLAGSEVDGSLPAQIRQFGVTHLQCTPSLASILVQEEGGREALAAIEVMMVGGEALPGVLAADLLDAGVGRLLNMYGPTETTIWSAVHEVTPEDIGGVPIGTPIANTSIYVLDEQLRLLPVGVPGELLIGGAGVTRGYLGREALTAERFVPNPFGGQGERLYRTGDLVRWRDDGVLEFLGRIDHQVKIRGHRIELGEIEATLAQCAGVRENVVVAREDTPGDVRLVAYVIPASVDDPPEARDIRSQLRAHLPEPMVPSHFVFLERFPQTPNRKIDRKALPSPAEAPRRERSSEPAGDATEAQARIIAVWQDVLQLPAIDIDDNFFDIGGHSLLAVKVHRRLVQEFDSPIGITDLFRFPTVRALSDFLGGAADESTVRDSQERGATRRQAMAMRRRRRTSNETSSTP